MSAGRRNRRTRRTLFVGPEIPEDADERVREGIARRRLVATTGRCPCGAVLVVPEELEPGTINRITIQHETGCPAVL